MKMYSVENLLLSSMNDYNIELPRTNAAGTSQGPEHELLL